MNNYTVTVINEQGASELTRHETVSDCLQAARETWHDLKNLKITITDAGTGQRVYVKPLGRKLPMQVSDPRRRMSMRDYGSSVEISYWCELSECRVSREFFVASGGGYVFERMDDNSRQQVCGELAHMGEALRSAEKSLGRVVRREYRRMIRSLRALAI